jgi:sigma-B regulation protein RsbU (phosphoserine phosphatase)
MALGVAEDVSRGQESVQIAPGDVLILYTDGVTEARNAQGAFLGKERLSESVRAALGCSAQGIQDELMADIREFVNDAPQSDDIALAAIVREAMDNFSPGQVTRYVPRLGER